MKRSPCQKLPVSQSHRCRVHPDQEFVVFWDRRGNLFELQDFRWAELVADGSLRVP